MQEITVTPLEALDKLIGVASMIDTNECKDEAMYNALQGALVVAQTALAMAPKQEAPAGVVAWMSKDGRETTSAASKKFMETCGYGVWHEVAPRYVVPLYAAPAAANGALPKLPEPLEIYWPELHSSALGCGVEDRGLHDRYECAEYGWQDGVDKAVARVPDGIYDADQMHAYGQACAAAGPDAALVALIHKAQSILAHHLPPDGPDAKTTISALLGLLDGPESRAALSGAKGN